MRANMRVRREPSCARRAEHDGHVDDVAMMRAAVTARNAPMETCQRMGNARMLSGSWKHTQLSGEIYRYGFHRLLHARCKYKPRATR